MEFDKLLGIEEPDFDGETPGSKFWTRVAYWLLRGGLSFQYRTMEVSGSDAIPDDRGTLNICWHTNGLLDVAPVIVNHPRYFVIGARHDLVNHILIGFWARKLAAQPVIRQAELIRGGCTAEEAKHLNGRSLVRLSRGIASGNGCVLMPEGHSHHESHLTRFKTGPSRVLTSSVAIARTREEAPPMLVPLGLHFRKRHLYRTDIWVEFAPAVEVHISEELAAHGEGYATGNWVEPPSDDVLATRDLMYAQLDPLTPGSIDWDTYRGWKLLAHIDARSGGSPELSWREEVEGARHFRALSDSELGTHGEQAESGALDSQHSEMFERATTAARILDEAGLDASALSKDNRLVRDSRRRMLQAMPGMLLGLALLPLLLLSSGPQMAMGYFLGNRTDEGEDARTSYQYLAIILSPFIVWPLTAALGVLILATGFDVRPAILGIQPITLFISVPFYIVLFLLMYPLYYLVAKVTMIYCFDALSDFRRELHLSALANSADGTLLASLLARLEDDVAGLDE